eukprot:4123896-Pyramimonas_sp.AAC.1
MRYAEQQPRAAVPGLAKNIGAFLSFLNRILRAGHVWASVPKEVLDLFSLGLDLLLLPDLDQRMGQLVVQYIDLQTKFRGEVAKRWKGWLDEAFANGATGAHRATRLQERLEFISAPNSVQPFELADQAMDEWEDLWTSPGAPWTQLPGDAASWAQLPTIDGAAVREALLTFSWRTAVGQSRLHPRALWFTSDAALDCVAHLFMRCEEMLTWPPSRIVNVMVRLPKPDGTGCRLITLVSTLLRVWARVRRPMSRRW